MTHFTALSYAVYSFVITLAHFGLRGKETLEIDT
jgi:hypothetical protein